MVGISINKIVSKNDSNVVSKKLLIILFSVFLVISLMNVVILGNMSAAITGKIAEAKEKARPAKLEVTAVSFSDCNDCYDIQTALADLKKQNVDVTKEEIYDYKSEKGKQLVAQYSIGKLPVLIINGEVNKNVQLQKYWVGVGEQIGANNETALYTNIAPPYYNILEGRILGRVSISHLVDSSCTKCISLAGISNAFKKSGVKVVQERNVEHKSEEGKQLVEKFGVKKIPAMII